MSWWESKIWGRIPVNFYIDSLSFDVLSLNILCCIFTSIVSPDVCSREDFQRIPELAINPLGDRIINAFFPEGWVVPVAGLQSWTDLVYAGCVWVTATTKPNQTIRLFSCGYSTADLRSSVFSANSVWKKYQLGFLCTAGSVCIFGSCLPVLSVWKLKTRCLQIYH